MVVGIKKILYDEPKTVIAHWPFGAFASAIKESSS